ncbi:MAG: hypothetical protein HZA17_03225 [Nitrospirae bacterium]|nr:hypothetical protein [Nitrospirota bacterium]
MKSQRENRKRAAAAEEVEKGNIRVLSMTDAGHDIKRIIRYFRGREEVSCLYVFGSFANMGVAVVSSPLS